MRTLCKIDGVSYDVLVVAISETFNIVEGGNSGISLHNQREIRDLQGIKVGHSITFAPGDNPDAFDALVNHLFGSVRPYVELEVVHDQATITYDAAYNTGARRVAYIDDLNDVVGWDELTVDFRPMEVQIKPN